MSKVSSSIQDQLKLAAAVAGISDPILLVKASRMPVHAVVVLAIRLGLDPLTLFQSCEGATHDGVHAYAKSA